jgi:signal transduction histidine kinase
MNTVYTAFIDGVFAYNGKKLFELKPNGKSIYSPSLLVNGEDLFVATISDGIYWFKKNIFHKHLSTANGLLNDHILKIKNYNEILWILTNKSIEEWDYKKNQLNHHSFGDDLSLSNISDFVIWKNRIWAAYGHTIKILPIKSNKNFPPKVFIDYILVNNKDTLNTDALNLDYQQNKLTFVLSGLSMSSGNNLRFAYRLQGEKEPWKMVPANNFIIDFPGLRPGRYEFEVKAIGSDGTHGEAKIIPINIALPWWLKPWFLAIAVVLFVAITFLIFSARLRSIRNTNRLVLEKVNLESQWQKSMLTAIRSQMNPHFIFNALNTIQSYIYTNNKDKASNYMGKFSDLIRRILDYSGKEKISLAKEIEMLQLYIDLEMLRFENSLKSHIHVDEALNTESIFIPPMLIQPFVENAIKHGLLHKPDDRLLELRFEPDAKSKYLLISIEDNGIGRAKSREINLAKAGFHTSFAMEANSKRIEMLNLTSGQKFQMEIIDKKDKDGRSLGTLVVLKIEL